jgi:gas vesicle protein
MRTILGSVIGGVIALIGAYFKGKSVAKKDFDLEKAQEDNEVMSEEIKKYKENAKIDREIASSIIDKSPRDIIKQLRKAKAD